MSWVWAAPYPTEIYIVVRTDEATSKLRVRCGTDPSLAGSMLSPMYSTTEEGGRVARIRLLAPGGLAPHTRYYYRVEIDGDTSGPIHRARTLPAVGSQVPWRFAWSSCAVTGSTSPVFARIASRDPSIFFHLGDLHYANRSGLNPLPSTIRSDYDASVGVPEQQMMFGQIGTAYKLSDHDWGPNDADKTVGGAAVKRQVFREYVPVDAWVSETELYRSIIAGWLRLIVTDDRTEKDPKGLPDDEEKRVWSPEQEAWIRSEMLAAKAAGQGIVLAFDAPWIVPPTEGVDTWGGYSTQRRRHADWMQEHDLNRRTIIIAGDMHGLGLDDGTHSNFATNPVGKGPLVFQAAPLHQDGSVKGGPYSHGSQAGGLLVGQFAEADVGAPEGDYLPITLRGWRNDDPWVMTGGITEYVHHLYIGEGTTPDPDPPTGIVFDAEILVGGVWQPLFAARGETDFDGLAGGGPTRVRLRAQDTSDESPPSEWTEADIHRLPSGHYLDHIANNGLGRRS